MSRYQFIEQVATTEPVQVLCRVLHVSPAGYYQWLRQAAQPRPAWEPAAATAFSRHAQRYGTRRLRAELRAEGHVVGRYALRTWLRRCGLRALSTRPQRPRTTVTDPAAVVAENLLLGQPAPTALNQVWVGDITYLPLLGGGVTWPLGAIPVRGAWWAGTSTSRCPPSWCSRPWSKP